MKRQFKAFLAGVLSTAVALPVSVAFAGQSNDPVYHQAPPATPEEWQDAMTAIGAGLEPEAAVLSQFEEMRLYAVWLSSVWECAFGRALTPNDPYPTIQQAGMLSDGVYELHSHTGETASIELVRTSHVTRTQLLDLLDPGMQLDVEVLGFGTAYAQITGDGCTNELLVQLHHLEIDGVQKTVVFVGSEIPIDVFYAMKITTEPLPGFLLQQPLPAQPGPTPQPVCNNQSPCAQAAKAVFSQTIGQQVAAISGCETDYKINAAGILIACAGAAIFTAGWALVFGGAGCGLAIVQAERIYQGCVTNANQAIANAWAQLRLDLLQCGFTPPPGQLLMWTSCYDVGGGIH